MASYIKRGESLFIPFREGLSISDSQLRPRIYKSTEQFEKHFPGYYKGTAGVELVEYAEVVHGRWDDGVCTACGFDLRDMIDGESEFNNWVWEGVPYCPDCGAEMRERGAE